MRIQEIRDTGVPGYQYIEVNDDLAANVLHGNSALIHLGSDQIPADISVSQPHTCLLHFHIHAYIHMYSLFAQVKTVHSDKIQLLLIARSERVIINCNREQIDLKAQKKTMHAYTLREIIFVTVVIKFFEYAIRMKLMQNIRD